METKKKLKFDLERKRSIFFTYGLVISLALVLLAFESGSEVKGIDVPEFKTAVVNDVIDIPSTSDPKPLFAPPPPPLKLFDAITIVDNTFKGPDFDIDVERLDDPVPLPMPENVPDVEVKPLLFAEFMPEFPGGNKSLNK